MTADKFHLSSLKASSQYAPNFVKFILNEYLTSFWFVFNKLLAGFIQLLRLKSELQYLFFCRRYCTVYFTERNESIEEKTENCQLIFIKLEKFTSFLGEKQ